jgi:hypothetical protein
MLQVILATNIAETSITFDDVVFVVDYGRQKVPLLISYFPNRIAVHYSASRCPLPAPYTSRVTLAARSTRSTPPPAYSRCRC